MRVIIRESSLLGLLAYTVWFSWAGLDLMKRSPCGTFIFFAAKVNLYGTYRTVFKAFSISALVCGMIKQLDTAVQLSQRWRGNVVRDPDYYVRLQAALIDEAAQREKLSPEPLPTVDMASQGSQTIESEMLEAAVQAPLPKSPSITGLEDRSSEDKSDDSSSRASDTEETSFPSLDELILAERYLLSIINIDVRDHSQWCYEIKWIPLKIFLPSIHSPSTLYKRTILLSNSRPFRISLLIPLFRHIKSLCRFPLYSYFFMLEAALRSPLHKQVSSSALITTLALHKAQLPANRPVPNVVLNAAASLSMCMLLVLSVELSLRWNSITGLGHVGATGQLIPAIIGLGGLFRVVWVRLASGEVRGRADDGAGKEIRDCAELYQRLKREREMKGEVQSS